jgi:hypothetical protein
LHTGVDYIIPNYALEKITKSEYALSYSFVIGQPHQNFKNNGIFSVFACLLIMNVGKAESLIYSSIGQRPM